MKHIFSSLTWAALALVASAAFAQGSTPIPAPASEPGTAGQGTEAQALVAAAARRILAEQAVSADLRYKIDAFGHVLAGTGKYLQLGAGSEKLLRLELKMQVGDQPATVQEICGPDFYWIRRDVPPAPATLGRVNLRQFRQTLALAAREQPGEIMPTGNWLVLGGLPRLIAALEQNFDFTAARADELQFPAANDGSVQRLPIWIVDGAWKPDRLAALTGGKVVEDPAELPAQLPDRVQLVLGRTSDVLPLFPYRITYLRSSAGKGFAGRAGEGVARELLSLELFNVHRKDDIDPREFEYNPGNQEVRDLTATYVQRISGETKVR